MIVAARPAEGNQGKRRRYVQRRPAPRDESVYELRPFHPIRSLTTLIECRLQTSDAIRQTSTVSADSSFAHLKNQTWQNTQRKYRPRPQNQMTTTTKQPTREARV